MGAGRRMRPLTRAALPPCGGWEVQALEKKDDGADLLIVLRARVR